MNGSKDMIVLPEVQDKVGQSKCKQIYIYIYIFQSNTARSMNFKWLKNIVLHMTLV